MADLNIIAGDLEALRDGVDTVAEALGSAPFGDAAGYVASGMPGSRSAQVVLQACQSIDDAWAALAQALRTTRSTSMGPSARMRRLRTPTPWCSRTSRPPSRRMRTE